MNEHELGHYSVYRTVIENVMHGQESLPSLPAQTLRIRNELINPNTDNDRLASLIESDPSLCALIMKHVNNPLFYRTMAPASLASAIARMGMEALDSVVMFHSVRSLYVMRNPALKQLYKLSWKRIITKAVLSQVLAKAIRFSNQNSILMSCLLSEIGSLSVLSALDREEFVLDENIYVRLCREYSKSLGIIILSKWGLHSPYVNTIRSLGQWGQERGPGLDVVDIINLGLYQAILRLQESPSLPPLQEIISYQHLPVGYQTMNDDQSLRILDDHQETIDNMLRDLI